MDPQRHYYAQIRAGDLSGLKAAFRANPALCREARPYGQSLVLHAVLENQIDLLKFLIEQGCDVNAGDEENGLAPLHAAALKNTMEAVKILLAAGAEIDREDKFGDTPLFRAVFAYQGDPTVMTILLERGADPRHNNKSGVSPLKMAEKKNLKELIELLSKRTSSAPATRPPTD